ncbi:MAG: hypothetical protein ACJA1R_000243 [Flavobacteriales bacterium]|jgi:hypothetical protein
MELPPGRVVLSVGAPPLAALQTATTFEVVCLHQRPAGQVGRTD